MTKLEHLQSVLLMIVKDVDSICSRNGIRFFLLGGSAIGAVRHHGFIPWDDDLDIIMDNKNYERFIKVCRNQLDKDKYYFQERFVDWPMPFSKIKLRGTSFSEPSGFVNDSGESGIFIDVFSMENAPSSKIKQVWQYFWGKYFLCYCLKQRGWNHPSLFKRFLMLCASPLNNPNIRSFALNQIDRYNKCSSSHYFFYSGRYRMKNSFYKQSYFSSQLRLPFEDTELPVPSGYDEWLTLVFGDYMSLPPIDKRVSLHLLDIDFGQY